MIGQTDKMAQHHNNVPFYPPQLPQQAQMTPFPYMQLPYPQQVYNSLDLFGGSDMTWTSSVTASHSLQSSPVVRMTPSVTVTVTSSFSTLHTSQSRAVDTPITTLHDQYGSSSQQEPRPFIGTTFLPSVPVLPQVSHIILHCGVYTMHNKAINLILAELVAYSVFHLLFAEFSLLKLSK